jgi:chemotaxis protein MotB
MLGFMVIYLVSCVPQRKYEEAVKRADACETENKTLRDSARKVFDANAELKNQVAFHKKATDALSRDTGILGASYCQMRQEYDHINRLNEDIMRKLALLENQSKNEATTYSQQLEATRLELQKKEEELKRLERDLKALEAELNQKKLDLAAREARIKELEDLIAKQSNMIKDIKDKLNVALNSFKDRGLTVVEKDGLIYVSMEAKLLFASGSYSLENGAKEILIQLAKVLETQNDVDIIVEGHTDTDKLNSTNVPRDNWELSVLRATSVVKFMLANSKMDPKRISAAGRGEFIPVDPNDKAKNRRIEVIILPKMAELFKILDDAKK